MEYNTERGDMVFREYGRIINKIIDYVCDYPDGEEKKNAASAVVYAMAQVAGVSVKDDVSYHKLWDHLMILSDFRLEDAWPFDADDLNSLKTRVQNKSEKETKRLPYKDDKVDKRYYGAYLEKMLKKMKDMPDGEEYQALTALLAQQAKRSYLVWNGELADDNIVVKQISKISNDARIEQSMINQTINVPANTLPVEPTVAKKKKKKK